MGTIKKNPDEELWYDRIAKNFSFPRDADLSDPPVAGAGKIVFVVCLNFLIMP